jgi:putative ABC transport system substrate-binding protein
LGADFLAYGPDVNDMADRYAGQVDQILKGAKPAHIPFYQPTKFILAINLRTAKALGLNISSAITRQRPGRAREARGNP